jgi:hypothetical protein
MHMRILGLKLFDLGSSRVQLRKLDLHMGSLSLAMHNLGSRRVQLGIFGL